MAGGAEREPPSLLVTFDDAEHLTRELDEQLRHGTAFAPGEHDLRPGDACEVVLIHPESGDSVAVAGQVSAVGEAGVEVGFTVTTLVENRLRQLQGATAADSVHHRVRALTWPERRRLARRGELTERVALERAFHKDIWPDLLDNPKLSIGEVIRLARMGNMPQPLLERIVFNNTWIRVPQIRRALLGNPRLDAAMVRRVLRNTPVPELKLVPGQTAYPSAVRAAARTLLQAK